MKTVSGKVVSSRLLSLSKAAKYLARFSASDYEVSPAFAAYLRRTTSAFNELAELHKKYKIPRDDVKAKEDHSDGVLTQGTSNSAKIAAEDAVPHSTSKGRKREGRDMDGSHCGLSINKASKGSEDEVEERHGAGRFELDKATRSSGHAINKVREEREHSSIKSAVQRGDINDGSIDETSDKKPKKKPSHEAEERETGHKIETEAVDKKASKKRKHEKVEDGGLDASLDAVRSKKKKHKH